MAPLFSDEKNYQPSVFASEKHLILFLSRKKSSPPFFSSEKVSAPCRLSRPRFPINFDPSLMEMLTTSILLSAGQHSRIGWVGSGGLFDFLSPQAIYSHLFSFV